MKTFESAQVRPVEDMLEATIYVRAKNEEIKDLTAKLAAAQAELHELRIAVGLGEHWRPAPMGRYPTAQGFIEVLSQGDAIMIVSGAGDVFGERETAWATLPASLAVFCRVE